MASTSFLLATWSAVIVSIFFLALATPSLGLNDLKNFSTRSIAYMFLPITMQAAFLSVNSLLNLKPRAEKKAIVLFKFFTGRLTKICFTMKQDFRTANKKADWERMGRL